MRLHYCQDQALTEVTCHPSELATPVRGAAFIKRAHMTNPIDKSYTLPQLLPSSTTRNVLLTAGQQCVAPGGGGSRIGSREG